MESFNSAKRLLASWLPNRPAPTEPKITASRLFLDYALSVAQDELTIKYDKERNAITQYYLPLMDAARLAGDGAERNKLSNERVKLIQKVNEQEGISINTRLSYIPEAKVTGLVNYSEVVDEAIKSTMGVQRELAKSVSAEMKGLSDIMSLQEDFVKCFGRFGKCWFGC